MGEVNAEEEELPNDLTRLVDKMDEETVQLTEHLKRQRLQLFVRVGKR